MNDAIPTSLGQVVQLFKDIRGSDGLLELGHTAQMPPRVAKQLDVTESQLKGWTPPPKSLYIQAVRARVALARDKSGFTQEQMADRLGVRASKYAKWENRGLMPHIYLARFSELTGISLKELLRDPR